MEHGLEPTQKTRKFSMKSEEKAFWDRNQPQICWVHLQTIAQHDLTEKKEEIPTYQNTWLFDAPKLYVYLISRTNKQEMLQTLARN